MEGKIISMEYDVSYLLDSDVRNSIIKIKNMLFSKLSNSEIFLFGSIAKGKYNKNSDIDLLVLIDSNNSTRELRYLRHELEDCIEELNIDREVDIKLYNKKRYEELSKIPCFESAILNDLIDIRRW